MQEKLAVFQVILTVREKARRGVMPLGSRRTVSSRDYSVLGAVSRPTGLSEPCPMGGGQELNNEAALVNGKGL